MIKDTNYVMIPGWVATKLGLKGNDLIIYSIIYGFSQSEGHCYKGSLEYLQEWTNSSRTGVIKNLKDLLEKGLITKVDSYPTNEYRAVSLQELDEAPSLQEEHKCDTIDTYQVNKVADDVASEIITYMNKVCKTNFKSNTAATKKVIKARLKEGFTVDDFKKVIDKKYTDWGVSPFAFSSGQMSSDYLRPATLFGDKFESYLNESKAVKKNPHTDSVSVPVDTNRSNLTF